MTEPYPGDPLQQPARALPPYVPAGAGVPTPSAPAAGSGPVPALAPYGAPAGPPPGYAGGPAGAPAPGAPPVGAHGAPGAAHGAPGMPPVGAYAHPTAPPAGLPPYGGVPAAHVPAPSVPTPAPAASPPSPASPPAEQRPAPAGTRAALRQAAPQRAGQGDRAREGDLDLDATLTAMVQAGASDLHLTSGAAPTIRLSGSLQPLEGFEPMQAEALRRTIYAVLTQKQREKFEANLELDLSYSVRGLARFRLNLYQQRESLGAAFRVIPYEIKPLEKLGVPPIVSTFAGLPRGLVLVTGPTGSGKSTTLASIIDLANRTRADHIMTVEDPIEFLHRHKKALVNQREVGEDTHSFANALKHVLRQDPDIILVGEMRDLETISVALTAAETGHLVFATLHTQDAAQTIDRVIDVFPASQQAQVRTQLAGAIQGVVSQTLCKRTTGIGRSVATEVMIATPAIRNLIREGKTHQIYSAMQAGAQQGMHTMDQHLAELVKNGSISYEVGLEKCHHIEDFNRLTGRSGGQTQGSAGLGHDAYGMQAH
ncbi:PilT/PilU family type 4a pilus ATPase [Cellulomonas sp. NPDC058312]|uniref:PilT/PilU family type 4a pilus ATPase n=1 Tax=Cellulomonas sp. NPDC058312 TaxID=3346441 RepID=UPI0036E96D3A